MTTQLLSLGLKKIRQPRVIAEVIGGIILGASYFFPHMTSDLNWTFPRTKYMWSDTALL